MLESNFYTKKDQVKNTTVYNQLSIIKLLKGFRVNRVYIAFWADLIFPRIELMFSRLTCFDMKNIVR